MFNWTILHSPRNIAIVALLAILALVLARRILKHPATRGEVAADADTRQPLAA